MVPRTAGPPPPGSASHPQHPENSGSKAVGEPLARGAPSGRREDGAWRVSVGCERLGRKGGGAISVDRRLSGPGNLPGTMGICNFLT
jgi:hypothetical protein